MSSKHSIAIVAMGLLVGCGPSGVKKEDSVVIVITDDGVSSDPDGTDNTGDGGTETVEPDCAMHERLVDGTCHAVASYLSITASLVQTETNGEVQQFGSLQACPMVATGEEASGTTPVYDDGTCVAYEIGSTTGGSAAYEMSEDLDPGPMVATSPTGETIEMLPMNSPCRTIPFGAGPAFIRAGETLTVTSEGADLPAFESQIVVPEPAALARGEVSPSAPVDLEWTGATPDATVQLTVTATETVDGAARGVSITCTADDNGAFTIPAAATELVPSEATAISTTLARIRQEQTFVDDAMFLSQGLASTQTSENR